MKMNVSPCEVYLLAGSQDVSRILKKVTSMSPP